MSRFCPIVSISYYFLLFFSYMKPFWKVGVGNSYYKGKNEKQIIINNIKT